MADLNLKIKHPKRHNHGKWAVPTRFVAAGTVGRAHDPAPAIQATLTKTNKKGEILPPAQQPNVHVHYGPVRNMPHGDTRYRWTVFFKVTANGNGAEGNFLLEVTATIGGQTDTSRVRFEIDDSPRGPLKGRPMGVIDILYPIPEQNIIDEREYFVAYGTRATGSGTFPITDGRVTVGADNTPPDDVFDDTLGFWYLQFTLTKPTTHDPDQYMVDVVAKNGNHVESAPTTVCIVS